MGHWISKSNKASIAFKVEQWSNNFGGVGSGLSEPALALVANDFKHRCWHIWLYPSPGTPNADLEITLFWDEAIIESTQPGGLATGKINPSGLPVVFYHDKNLKILFAQWPGEGNSQPAALYRANLFCEYIP